MKRKNNRNLLGVIALIAICAFMLISCPQQTSTLAKENPRALTLNYSGRSTIYYYLNNNWYSDKECKNVVEDQTLQPPAAQTATITVNFNEGTTQATGEEYFTSGANPFTWNFVKYVKAGDESKADYFGGELKLPENGISENVTLTAEYDTTEVVRKLPVLVKEGITFGGYQRVNVTVEADMPIPVTPGLIATYNAIWTTYKTLTLNIGEQEQKLYYGSNGAWYSALSGDGLLLDENKVTGDEVKFNIPSAPTWTVTFKKNPKSGMNDSEITITPDSVDVTPALTLTPGDLIDNTGKVSVDSIDGDKVVTGTYPPKAIGQSVIAESTNLNYAFEKWTVNGADIVDIANHQVNGNTEVFANWKNISDFKVLTVKDGDAIKDTVYYNIKDGKWYVSNITTSEEKTSVAIPEPTQKTYIATLNFNNDSGEQRVATSSSFSGYCDINGKQVLKNNGSLKVEHEDGYLIDYTINSDTILFAKWSEAKFYKPAQPTKDGYTFDGWYNGENPYDFNSVVTGDMTLTAHWTKKTFNTLTLNIGGQEQKLYYGSDDAWYKALSEGGLLIDDNKVTGDEVKFIIPSAPKWTVTFNKNTPAGANDNEISISRESVVLTPELSLSPDNVIDKATGKVLPGSISETKTVTGTYPPKVIRESVTASSTNTNYEFEKWTVNGEDIDITTYKVNGNTEIVANWNNISAFKVLTIKDGDVVKEKAYFNTDDDKWYNSNITTSGEKTSVLPLSNREYTLTLDFDNDSPNGNGGSVTSSFRGYGVDGTTSAVIGIDGSLNGYTIDKDTVLVSLWSEVKFTEPSEQPTKDGYVFDSWYKDGQQYDFNSVVTGDMTLTAHWTKKTYNTLTFDITGLESPVALQKLYYGSDGAWYKALGNDDLLLTKNKVTGDEVKFIIPETHAWTVTLNKNTPTNENRPFSDADITLSTNHLTLYPKDGVFSSDQYISRDGKVKEQLSITENVNVTLDTSRRRTSENVTAKTPDSIKLVGWLNGDEKISDLSNYVVTADNINLNASWGYKVSIGALDVSGRDADRGFYTTLADIDESVADKSKQQRVAYYAEGQTVKLYYDSASIMFMDITLKNEWTGETKLIDAVGTHSNIYTTYYLLEIPSMPNQPLSISFNVKGAEPN